MATFICANAECVITIKCDGLTSVFRDVRHIPMKSCSRTLPLRALLSGWLTRLGLVIAVWFTVELQSQAQAPVLTPFVPGANGIVSGEVSHQIAFTGTATRFAATGLPPGLTLNTTTGLVTGRPNRAGNYTVVLRAWNGTVQSQPLSVSWTVEPLPAGTAGTFNAILDRHPWYNGNFGGSLRITVASDGSYSGVITRGIHRNSITGRLTTQVGGFTPTGSFQVPRVSPYAPLTVSFSLPLGAGTIIGSLNEPQGDVIGLAGYRAGFTAAQPALTYVGRWNSALELPAELVGNAAYPQGAGWASQVISSSGGVTWVSRLADGTGHTFSTGLAAGGQTLVHLMLYQNSGSVQGVQSFLAASGLTIGSLGWVKTANPYSRYYPAGIPQHALTLSGSRYIAPAAGEMLFGITPGTDNARLVFTGGGLAAPHTQLFSLDAKNKATLPVKGAANPYGITFTMNLLTGFISGSGTAMDFSESQPTNARAGSFSGLIILGRNQAVGHFLLPVDRSTKAQVLSGKWIAEENPSTTL